MVKGACMVKGVCMVKGGMCGEGACVVKGHVWQRGACVVKGACMVGGMHGGGMHGRGTCMAGGHVWQERRPLQPVVWIVLEYILVQSAFPLLSLGGYLLILTSLNRNLPKCHCYKLSPNMASRLANELACIKHC